MSILVAPKLIYKLTILAIVPIVISMVVFGSISYTIYKEKLIQERIEEATFLIDLSADEIKNPLYFLELNKLNSIIGNIKKNPNVLSVYITDPNGRVITDGTPENNFYNQFLKDDFTKKSIKSNKPLVEVKDDILQSSAPAIINQKIGIIRIDYSLRDLDQVLFNLVTTLGMIGSIILLVVVAVGISISSSISKPITKLRDAADEIAKGNLGTRMEINSKDEVGELAGAFNKMVEDLQASRDEIISAKEYTDNIVRSMTDTLIVVSPDGAIQKVNPAACTLLGYREKELIGQPVDIILAGRKEPLFNVSMGTELAKKGLTRNVEKTYLAKDGRSIPMSFSASIMHDNDNRIQGVVCVAQDITERKQAEKLQKERARAELYGFIVSALPVFASGVPSQVRNTLVSNFAERFETNVRPKFEDEMRRSGYSPKVVGGSIENTQERLDGFMLWLAGLFSNFGIQTRTTPQGPKMQFEFLNCPWIGEAKGNPIFCFICRTIVIRSLTWTSLKGSANQGSSIANGSETCKFELRV